MVKITFEIPNVYEELEQHKIKRKKALTDDSINENYENNLLVKSKLEKLKGK